MMKVDVCYNQATKKVAFVEAPSSFIDLLNVLKFCTPLAVASVLKLDLLEDGTPAFPLSALEVDGSRLSTGMESCQDSMLSLLAQKLNITTGVGSREAEVTSDDDKLHVCTSVPNSCAILFQKAASPTPCAMCKLCGQSSPCTPEPIKIIPSYPGQKGLDTYEPMYRCTTPTCKTYSNSRMIPCSVCQAGVMGFNAGCLDPSDNSVRTALATNAPSIAGDVVIHYNAGQNLSFLTPVGLDLGMPKTEAFRTDVDLKKPLYLCSGCYRVFSNRFSAKCGKCNKGKTMVLCTVATRNASADKGIEFHAWHSSTQACSTKGKEELVLLDDNLRVFPNNSFIQRMKLLKKLGIFSFEDFEECTINIGPKEVLLLCEVGHQKGCTSFFT